MRIFLAATDTAVSSYDYDPFPTSRYFATYFYRKNTEKVLDRVGEGYTGDLFIDSGAHTVFGAFGMHCSTYSRRKVDVDELAVNYFNWIKVNYHRIRYFADLDVQEVVGLKKVLEWRRMFYDAGLANKMVCAYHYGDTVKDFDKMLEFAKASSNYVALQGIRKDHTNIDHMKFIKRAYEARVKIHGYAMTKKTVMETLPFWSVDSSSWTACWRYGQIFKFDKNRMLRIANNPSQREKLMRLGVDPVVLGKFRTKEEIKKKAIYSEIEWRKYEEYLRKLWIRRGINWDERLAGCSSTGINTK